MSQPLTAPASAPAASPPRIATIQCCSPWSRRPQTTPTRPISEPTERSMPPVRITAVMPIAMMPMKAKLRVML
jgi:hypothetical protein